MIDVGVVVPVHDEAADLPACLDALQVAVDAVAGRARVHVLVVLDRCGDRSAEIARDRGVDTLTVDHGVVGAARAAGCDRVLRRREVAWLACTDADSMVPADWLGVHLDAADAGVDVLVGIVAVHRWEGQPDRVRERFDATYGAGSRSGARDGGHPHVHGANLGVRAEAYRRAGGFAPVACGEDVALVENLERVGATVLRTCESPVRTSARRTGRAPGGFADHLGSI